MANKIQNNNTSLEQILATINALPEEGSGGVELPGLSNPGVADDLVVGKQLIDGDGEVVTGTNPYEKAPTDAEVNEQADLLQQITTTLAGKTAVTPILQSKTVTPTTSSQNITPDSGYDGLSQVTVNAMPTATQATPSISVSSGGLITASATQSAGYVTEGTKSATKQLTVQAAQTITPGTSNKTIASGRYLTGTQTIKGDANLKAANIAKGVSIFGVTGTHEGGEDVSAETAEYTSLLTDLEAAVDALPDAGSGGSGGGSVETCTVTITQYKGGVFVPMDDTMMFYTGADSMATCQTVNDGSIVTVVKNSLVVLYIWPSASGATNAEMLNHENGVAGYKITGDAILEYAEG